MNNLKTNLLCVFLGCFAIGLSQRVTTNTWKAQIALGINSPSQNGFVEGATANSINLPTVNLGVQHMFNTKMGAKLDYGFNRMSNEENSPEFKINYSRINVQFVYDPSSVFYFLPSEIRTVFHTGPGYSFATPLNNLDRNKQSYLNWLAGLEIHYALSEKVSVYLDYSYIHGFTDLENYDPALSGLGAFNGSVNNLTFGVSISLSGCQFCD
ncbi:outer membrane beta-barrel protein [Winogradskyella maritima]|uniref:Outer membrane beta-barrel protein n=1 Tax=Winogradskyella maritima TaxID=1517766 RepID=A0ABV8AEX8_9FLAO|nr:outer membrane beta-barrel protein [Winogradskyella maritima]